MSKWDFIKEVAQKATKSSTKNTPEQLEFSFTKSTSKPKIDKKRALRDAALAGGSIAGATTLMKSGEDPEEQLTGFENIDEISPELLKILIENGYIYDPDNELLEEEEEE